MREVDLFWCRYNNKVNIKIDGRVLEDTSAAGISDILKYHPDQLIKELFPALREECAGEFSLKACTDRIAGQYLKCFAQKYSWCSGYSFSDMEVSLPMPERCKKLYSIVSSAYIKKNYRVGVYYSDYAATNTEVKNKIAGLQAYLNGQYPLWNFSVYDKRDISGIDEDDEDTKVIIFHSRSAIRTWRAEYGRVQKGMQLMVCDAVSELVEPQSWLFKAEQTLQAIKSGMEMDGLIRAFHKAISEISAAVRTGGVSLSNSQKMELKYLISGSRVLYVTANSMSMETGQKKTIQVKAFPDGAVPEIVCRSTSSGIVSCAGNEITAIGSGETIILVKERTSDMEIGKVRCRVSYVPRVKEIRTSSSHIVLTEGEKKALPYDMIPADAVDRSSIRWNTEGSCIRLDEAQNITAVRSGTAMITARAASGAFCKWNVEVRGSVNEIWFSEPGSPEAVSEIRCQTNDLIRLIVHISPADAVNAVCFYKVISDTSDDIPVLVDRTEAGDIRDGQELVLKANSFGSGALIVETKSMGTLIPTQNRCKVAVSSKINKKEEISWVSVVLLILFIIFVIMLCMELR